MADNQQNTYAGGAGPLAPSTGNGILDSFLNLSNVAVQAVGTVYGAYDSIRDMELAREIQKQNATRPPMQSMPASQANSPAEYLSNPAQVQAIFFYGAMALALSAGIFLVVKKL